MIYEWILLAEFQVKSATLLRGVHRVQLGTRISAADFLRSTRISGSGVIIQTHGVKSAFSSAHIKLVGVKQNVISEVAGRRGVITHIQVHHLTRSSLKRSGETLCFIALITWKKLGEKQFAALLRVFKAYSYMWSWFVIPQIISLYKHSLNKSKSQTLY